MDDHEDPALQFFPDGEVDLYGALGVDKSTSNEEIKKAYRKLALRYHPDKVLSSASTSTLDPHQKFQQINFAYTVLSDETRRKRYDSTGKTNESMFEQDGFSWDEYFKEMWQGNVSGEKLNDFKKNYQNSNEERADLLEAYETAKGDLETIFTLVPCCEILEDETRFISTIQDAIKAGEIKKLPGWDKTVNDTAGRKKMRAGAKKEAKEAEEYAKELGVWDDLYGKKKGAKKDRNAAAGPSKRKAANSKEEAEVVGDASSDEDEEADEEDDDDEEPVQANRRAAKPSSSNSKSKSSSSSKSNAKASSSKASSSKKNDKAQDKTKPKKPSTKKKAEEEEDDLDGLQSLMAKRGAERSQGFNDMIARLEAKATGSSNGKGGKKKHPAMYDDHQRDPDEPDEEAFLKAREKIDARKRKADEEQTSGSKSSGGSGSGKAPKSK